MLGRSLGAKWEINNKCNLACSYCMVTERKGLLTFEQKLQVMDKLSSMGIDHIDFYGMEPLLDDEIFRLMDYGGDRFTYSFITNGVNLEKFADEILKRKDKIKFFTVSYEGTGRGRNFVFDLDILDRFVDQMHVEISVDVHKDNWQQVIAFILDFYRRGVGSVYLKPILPIGGNADAAKEFFMAEQVFMKFIEKIAEIDLRPMPIYISIPWRFWNATNKYHESKDLPENMVAITEKVCYAGDDTIFISCNGKAYGCAEAVYVAGDDGGVDFLTADPEVILESIKPKCGRPCVIGNE